MKRIIRGMLCLGLTAFLLYISTQGMAGAAGLGDTQDVLCLQSGEGLQAGDIRRMKREQGEESSFADFVLWGEGGRDFLRNEGTKRSCQTEIFYLCGSSRLLYPGEKVLDEEDREGCLIGRKAAYELFGTDRVQGCTVYLGETAYRIQGVLAEDSCRLYVRAPDDCSLNLVTARIFEDQTYQEVEQILLTSYGISGTRLEFGLLSQIAGIGSLALWAALGIGTYLILGALERRLNMEQKWKKRLVGFSFLALWILFAVRRWPIPEEYLPSRWSDFDFFANLWEEKREALFLLLETSKKGPQAAWVFAFMKTMFCQMAGILGWLTLGIFVRAKSGQNRGEVMRGPVCSAADESE